MNRSDLFSCCGGIARCLLWNQIIAVLFFLLSVWDSSLAWPLLLSVYLTLTNSIGLSSYVFFATARAAASRGLFPVRVPAIIAVTIVGAIAGMFLGYYLSDTVWGVRISGRSGMIFNLVFASVVVGSFQSYAFMAQRVRRATEELRQRELRELDLLRLQAETELRALQSAIEPHFLFNALNSIATLTSEDPRRAEAALLRLSELLRTVIDASRTQTIPLEQELSIVRNYLEIERIRFEERLSYGFDVAPELLSVQVPGLLVQPLVENAVKHGVSVKRASGRVQVSARRQGAEAVIQVTDDGEGRGVPGTGLGLENLRQRLRTAYGQEARLDLRRENGLTLAQLTIPLAPVVG